MRINVLDHTGHSTLEFDAKTEAGVRDSATMLDELTKNGYLLAVPHGDGTSHLYKKGEIAETVDAHPRIVGG